MSFGEMSVTGASAVNGAYSANSTTRSVSSEEAMFDFSDKGGNTSEIASDGGMITRNPDGSIKSVTYVNEDGSVYSKSVFNSNTETVYYTNDEGKLAPFAEHVYDPATQTGTATPYVDGKLDTSYTLKYPMDYDESGKPYLIDKPMLPDEPKAAEQPSATPAAPKASTVTPSEANAKWANVKFEQGIGGGYGKEYDGSGRIANRVYTDSAGNVTMYTEYSYRPDGSIDKTRTYSLHNGEFKLSDEVTYSEDNKTAVGQGYSVYSGEPHPGKINYTTEKVGNELQLVFKAD